MTTEKREQRWCLCGWTIYGTEMERRNAFTKHWQSTNHRVALTERPERPVGVEIVVSKESPE